MNVTISNSHEALVRERVARAHCSTEDEVASTLFTCCKRAMKRSESSVRT